MAGNKPKGESLPSSATQASAPNGKGAKDTKQASPITPVALATDAAPADASSTASRVTKHEDMRARIADLLVRAPAGGRGRPGEGKVHKFWSTQPVVQFSAAKELSDLGAGHAIETKSVADIPPEPYTLLPGFEWAEIDVTNDTELEEAYRLLNLNYIEDGDAMFRFDYSRDFLKWALMPPGWKRAWHLGVRVSTSRKLVAFITAIPATVGVHHSSRRVVEINFLCVHKKLRSKRLAPMLIREITRRVNLEGIWQAVYTAGITLPRPVSSSHYYHRSLNPKKLIDVHFSRLAPRMTMARTLKLYALKSETNTPGIRPLEARDVPAASRLLHDYLIKFALHVEFTEEDFAHWLLPREGVIYSYVVEDPESKEITDLVSFYSLPSSIIKNPQYKTLNAAYSFCNAAVKTPLVELMRDALILAKRNDFDVFNALDLAENAKFFRDLHFHIGDGMLHYYLYNWKCRPMENTENALVLL